MANRGADDVATRNVDLIRGTYAALNRGDLEAWLAPLHPDVHVRDHVNGVEAAGRDQFCRWIEHYLEAWDYYRETPERIESAGDKVVALVKSEARGIGSGVAIEECHGEVHTVRDGLIVELTFYPTYKQALDAVGLPE